MFASLFVKFQDHLKIDCGYTPVKCDNQRCEKILLRRLLETHMKECVYSSTVCEHCKLDLARIDLEVWHRFIDTRNRIPEHFLAFYFKY